MTEPASGKVLIVESMPIVAWALADLLAEHYGMDSVICTSEREALAACVQALDFGRIFLDLDAAGSYGLSLVRYFVDRGAQRRCVIVSGAANPRWIEQARAHGVLAYLLKTAPVEEFRAALELVMRGKPSFPPVADAVDSARLTRRQQDIVDLLHRGYSSKKIASQLCLKTGTVDNHVTGLMRALNASSRTHAVARAMELGYVTHRDQARV
jgi:DNA-binding NarL/FixJ family response regulator